MLRRQLQVLATTALLVCGLAARTIGDEIPYWPSEQEARLEELDSELLDTQQKLFAARQENNTEATAELSKTFKECQEKRLNLLRAMGQLRSER